MSNTLPEEGEGGRDRGGEERIGIKGGGGRRMEEGIGDGEEDREGERRRERGEG